MDSSFIFHILITFGALQALFLVIVLLTKRRTLTGTLLALFLAIEGFSLVEILLIETNLMTEFPHILGTSNPFSLLKPSILFLLTLSIINPTFKFRMIHALHTAPFFLIALSTVPFYMLPSSKKIESVSRFIAYVPTYNTFDFWLFISFFMSMGIYLYYSIKSLKEYRSYIKNNGLANWYFKVLKLYIGLMFIFLLHIMLRPLKLYELPINKYSMVSMTFLIQSIAYSFLSGSKLLDHKKRGYFNDVKQLSKDRERIEKKLKVDKVYLDDTLDLDSFACSLELSKKYVSGVINQNFGMSFKDLVNKFRVNEAKSQMMEHKGTRAMIVEIGLRSGFNNKVSFYRTFKKHTGKSPTGYYQSLKKFPKKSGYKMVR